MVSYISELRHVCLFLGEIMSSLKTKKIQISLQMTTYGQTLGVFKRENNERSRVKTNLHKTKIVVF